MKNEAISQVFKARLRSTDIETVGNSSASEYYAQKSYKAPSNYKDMAKITASIDAQRRKDQTKAGLSWWTGKICVICCGPETFASTDEKALLIEFFTYLQKANDIHEPYHLFGKSYLDFDKPFIIGRALANDIGLPDIFRPSYAIEDIDHIFSRYSRCAQVTSLNNYAWGLGIGQKSGGGAEVQGWYDEGDLKKISEYCRDDTLLTAIVYERAMKVFDYDNYIPF